MTAVLPHDATVELDLELAVVDSCAACAHPQGTHDALGARFCAATISSSLDRGCICR